MHKRLCNGIETLLDFFYVGVVMSVDCSHVTLTATRGGFAG